ncbi:MAG: hypothetical protein U1E46_07285 [Hyphomicrobiales bacterium]
MKFVTQNVRADQRAQFWRDVVSIIANVECNTDAESFSGSMEFGELGETQAFSATLSLSTYERTEAHIETAPRLDAIVVYQVAGSMQYEHWGRTCVLTPRSFALLDLNAPFRATTLEPCEQFGLVVSHAKLLPRLGDFRRALAVPLGGGPIGGLVSSLFDRLPLVLRQLDAAASLELESQVLDIVCLAVAREGCNSAEPVPPYGQSALHRLKAAIRDIEMSPDASPAAVAAKADMSLAEANLLLRSERTTLAELLRRARLESQVRALARDAHEAIDTPEP